MPHQPREHVRPARPEEAEHLSSLAIRSKAYWGYDATFMAACSSELSLASDEVGLLHTHVLVVSEHIVGFFTLEAVDTQVVELGHLFVEPDLLGRGYGRELLEHAKAKASSLGYRNMLIQGDPNASAFYRSAGAIQVGVRESRSIPGRQLPLFQLDLTVT